MKNKPNKQHATSPSQKREAKIQKLQLNKETIKDLTAHDAPAIKGGAGRESRVQCESDQCGYTITTVACWVARTVYGEDNPRWLLFRAWLFGDAPAWFRDLYIRRGESFALWIAPHSGIKSVIRRWMDWVIATRRCGCPCFVHPLIR